MSATSRLNVKQSIEQFSGNTDELSREFYKELFRQDIALKTIFPGSVVTLNRKFNNMLATFSHVKHLEKITPSVEKMGARHFEKYGAMLAHFELFEQALMTAFQTCLKDSFTPQLEADWRLVFAEVSVLMKAMAPASDVDTSLQSQASDVPENFLSEIGGAEKVLQVHIHFYKVMFADPWLGQFFYGKHESVLASKQTDFMVAAFGGPNHYDGDTPAFVHMHMYVTADVADFREQILRQSILACGLSAVVADIWLKVDSSFRSAIVKQELSECVMKCRGQVPVKAQKPAQYS